MRMNHVVGDPHGRELPDCGASARGGMSLVPTGEGGGGATDTVGNLAGQERAGRTGTVVLFQSMLDDLPHFFLTLVSLLSFQSVTCLMWLGRCTQKM